VLVIGEGPGEQEDRQGRPFVGPAGKLLDRMLAAVGLEPAEVYITNIVKCRPPGNRDPRPEEAAACRPFLEEQVRILGPELVLALGRPAAQSLLNSKAPISALRGSWHQFRGVPLMPTFHPAYLLRSPEKKGQAYQDLKALARALRQGVMEVKP
jgi:DNA polymerase